jgi:Uma2 family endonuclease
MSSQGIDCRSEPDTLVPELLLDLDWPCSGCSAETAPVKPPSAHTLGGHADGINVVAVSGTGYESPRGIMVDSTGNVLLTGEFFGTADFGGGPLSSAGGAGYLDIFVVKLDAQGQHLWSRHFEGRFQYDGPSVAVDSTGNVLLIGDFLGTVDLGGAGARSMTPRSVVDFGDGPGRGLVCLDGRGMVDRMTAAGAAGSTRTTYAEYVAAEAVAAVKHEYLRGEVRAMTGGSPEHSALAARIIALLDLALTGRSCRVFGSDARVRVQATDLTTYPDASVVCGHLEVDPVDPHAIVNPVLLVEVLSESTEAYDRGDKAAHYRRIASVREYLLVSQSEPRLELFRRGASGLWELHEAGPSETLTLASLDVTLATDQVYRNPLAAPPAAS